MGSSSGNSSGSSQLQNSGSEEELQVLMDQRKRKRMISNRESARRSRLRKQKHLGDLMSQVSQLTEDNTQILTTINVTTRHVSSIEAENSILRAQLIELSQRLQSLNEILNFINATASDNNGFFGFGSDHHFDGAGAGGGSVNPMNSIYLNQPIVASADFFY